MHQSNNVHQQSFPSCSFHKQINKQKPASCIFHQSNNANLLSSLPPNYSLEGLMRPLVAPPNLCHLVDYLRKHLGCISQIMRCSSHQTNKQLLLAFCTNPVIHTRHYCRLIHTSPNLPFLNSCQVRWSFETGAAMDDVYLLVSIKVSIK